MSSRPLIGRTRELETAAAALDGALASRTSLLLLSGDPGIGKSRLLEEIAGSARAKGLAVCWGRAWEAGGAPAFWPWIQLLRAALREGAAPPPEISRLLPELPGAALPRDPASDDRFLLFDAVLRFVSASAERTPLVLLLEDLHAADAASLQLLEFLSAHLRGARVACVGTFRELEVKLSPPTAALLDRVAREGMRLHVAPLQLDEVQQLSGTDAATAQWLLDATGGNPLFVTEMLHALPRRDDKAPALPEGVRAAIRRHLAALPRSLEGPLELAAVIGRELNAPLLAELMQRPLADVIDLLGQAVSLGVLVERGQGRWAFAHSLICDTLHLDLPARRRAELHLAVADALERTAAYDPTPPLAELARHLFEAGPEAVGRAADAAARAAERSLKALAFEQAEELLQRALDAVGLQSPSRFELLLALGRARVAAGRDDAGREACLAAANLVRRDGTAEQLARAALGYGLAFTFGLTDPVLVELLEAALQRLSPDDSPLRARCLGRLAAARQPSSGAVGVGIAREAIAMARRLDDARTRLDVFHVASAGLARFSPVSERAPLNAESLELATRLDEPGMALRARLRLVFDLVELGEVDQAWRHAEIYAGQARTQKNPRVLWPAMMLGALRATFEGRHADARRIVAEVEALGLDDPLVKFCVHNHLACVKRQLGVGDLTGVSGSFRSGEVVSIYDRISQLSDDARAGRVDPDRDPRLDENLADVLKSGDTGLSLWFAEVLYELKAKRHAQTLYESTLPFERQNALWTMHGMAVLGPVARALYQLASLLGRHDVALAHAAVALELMRREGGRPLEAHVLFETALLHEAAGDSKSAERARTAAIALGAPLGIEFRVHGPVAAEAVSLTREADFWTVRGKGALVRLKHGRGVEMLAKLVAAPKSELSALELSGSEGGVVDGGDAGELLDDEAKQQYRSRLLELEEELEEATGWNDPGRAERLREEADALRDELSRAVGLQGRSRRAGSATERARVNVQRRIADAIRKVSEGNAVLGQHLVACVKTGSYCSYHPERDRP